METIDRNIQLEPIKEQIKTLDEVKKAHIEETLKKLDYSRNKTAEALDISVRGLRNMIHDYGIICPKATGQGYPVEENVSAYKEKYPEGYFIMRKRFPNK